MRHTLHIQLRTCEGAVIRALGLIERRGFRLETVHAGEAQGDGQTLRVTVSGTRPVDLLKRQLERLYDVIWVEPDTADKSAGRSPHGTNPGMHGAGTRPLPRRT